MIDKLADIYFWSRPNKSKSHNKLAVFFLACSGSGKSTIRELIVEKTGATYLCNDEVRQLVREHGDGVSLKVIVNATWEKLRKDSQNQFIVFDSNISSYYMHEDSYYNVAIREGYRTYIIAINLQKEELTTRIKARNRYDTDDLLELLPAQLVAQSQAMVQLQPNFTVEADASYKAIITALQNFEAKQF